MRHSQGVSLSNYSTLLDLVDDMMTTTVLDCCRGRVIDDVKMTMTTAMRTTVRAGGTPSMPAEGRWPPAMLERRYLYLSVRRFSA